MDNLFSALLASGIAGGGGGGGSYTAGDGLSINDNEISVIPATTEALGGVIIGEGLGVDANGVLSTTNDVVYTAGNGITLADAPFALNAETVENTEYLFNTQVTAKIDSRTYTKYNTEPALGAIIYGDSYSQPYFVGLTVDSVKFGTNYDSHIWPDPDHPSFVYKGVTWYYSGNAYGMSGDKTDSSGHMQKLPGTYTYATESDLQDIARAIIDVAGIVTDPIKSISAKLGEGLTFDDNNAITVVDGPEYVAGQGIAFSPAGFNPDPAYYFTSQVECDINGRTFTKYNAEPAVAFVITNSSGYTGPVYVGLTANSVKYTQSWDHTVSDPDGSFEYQGYTWYYSHLGYFMPGSYTDSLGNLQKFTTYQPSEEQVPDVCKTMLDLARAVPSEDVAISAKLGEGLAFDANNAIKVDGLSELQAKTVGMSAGGSNYIVVGGIPFYVSSTAPTGNIPDGSVGVGW